jgi:hypothetical protein
MSLSHWLKRAFTSARVETCVCFFTPSKASFPWKLLAQQRNATQCAAVHIVATSQLVLQRNATQRNAQRMCERTLMAS